MVTAFYRFGAGPFNIIRRNLLHHILRGESSIRCDGWQSDTLVTENIIYESLAGGIARKHYNHVENNIIVNVAAKLVDGKGHPYAGYINFYSFPEDEPTTGSRVQRNILYHSGKDPTFYSVWDWVGRGRFTRPQDCHADYNVCYCAGDPQAGTQFIERMRADGIEEHSVSADPLFVDLTNGDFRLRPDSPALKMGFKPIDTGQIGLRQDFPPRFKDHGQQNHTKRSVSTPSIVLEGFGQRQVKDQCGRFP